MRKFQFTRTAWFVCFPLLVLFLNLSHASQLPDGMSLIGLQSGQWSVYIAKDGNFELISGIDSPRTASYHNTSKMLAYIGVDGKLRIHDIEKQTAREIVGANENSRFTQPNLSADGRWLFVVELPGGKSRQTNILGINLDTDEQHGIVRKRTAQFEPFADNNGYLYYTTASCVDDCDGMIWELWRRNIVNGKQEQITLLNALSNQPHVGRDGWVYFSSNANGGRFHIWRMPAEVGAPPEQLTSGNHRDSDPTTSADGSLFFIRKNAKGASLMRLAAGSDGMAVEIPLPEMDDMRNLEMGR